MPETPIAPGYAQSLDAYLKALDAAPCGAAEPVLKKATDKEYLETRVTHAVRARRAAAYHKSNTDCLLAAIIVACEAEAAAAMTMKSHAALSASSSVVSSTKDASEVVFELSALMSALRSGLDFISHAAEKTIVGVSNSTLSTLIGMAEKGLSGGVLAVVQKHHSWLTDIKNYRDIIIHRVSVGVPAAGWVVSTKGLSSKAFMPVVVPVQPPKFAYDTRRSRMMADELGPAGLWRSESSGHIQYPEGAIEFKHHEVAFGAEPGFAPVDEFMSGHIENYDAFLADMLDAIVALQFQLVKA